MEWTRENIDALELAWSKRGRTDATMPKPLRNRPDVPSGFHESVRIFNELHNARVPGNPISFTEMHAYFSLHEMGQPEKRRRVLAVVSVMDSAYFEWYAKKRDHENKKRK